MAESKRFLLRLDPRLFEAIRRWANDDLRSINAQIEYLLTDQARRMGRLPHQRSRPALPDPPPPEDEGEALPGPLDSGEALPGSLDAGEASPGSLDAPAVAGASRGERAR